MDNSIYELFDNTTDAVYGINSDCQIQYWNRRCEEIFGLTQKESIGKVCYKIFNAKDLLGNNFCSDGCNFILFHNKSSPCQNRDILVKDKAGKDIFVNIGSYYTGNQTGGIIEFHSLRVIESYQVLLRSLNSSATENNMGNIDNFSTLSKREYEVLREIVSGKKNKDISVDLGVSHTTLRNHIKNIYSKLEVHSLAEVIGLAIRYGIK